MSHDVTALRETDEWIIKGQTAICCEASAANPALPYLPVVCTLIRFPYIFYKMNI